MEDRFGYGAIVRAMRPEEREAMLELLLEAAAGEMPAGAGEEPPGTCPRCGCPHTVRRGRDADGAQRRLCRGCGRSFRASTGRVLGMILSMRNYPSTPTKLTRSRQRPLASGASRLYPVPATSAPPSSPPGRP